MRCFCPPDRRRPAFGDDRVETLRQRVDEILQLRRHNRLLEVFVAHGLAEADVLPQRQVEHRRVLEHEADLLMQRILVVVVERATVVLDAA